MKKILTIAVLSVMLVALLITGVHAATSETLADELYAKLAPYGATQGDKVQMQRYLADHKLTDEQANAILTKASQAVTVMDSQGVKNYKELTSEAKDTVKSLAQEAAEVIGGTVSFVNGKATVLDAEGNEIAVVSLTNAGTLVYTGNNNIAIVVSSIAVIALAAIVVAKTRSAKVGA